MITLLYIDGYLMDLDPGTLVALTLKSWEVGDIRTRNSNFTNRLKLPKSKPNITFLEYVQSIKSKTGKPYVKLPAKLVQGGIETVSNGRAVISEIDNDIVIELYSGVFGFFDAISNKKINQLDLAEFDLGLPDDGFKVPYINYGHLAYDDAPSAISTYYCFQYKIILEQIFNQAGYEKNGIVFSDARYAAMYLAGLGYGGYNTNFTKPKEFVASRDTSIVFNATGSYLKVSMTEVSGNESGYYDGTSTYEPGDPQGGLYGGAWYVFEGYAYMDVTIALAGGASGVDIQLFNNATGFYEHAALGNGNHKLNFEISQRVDSAIPTLTAPIPGQDGTEMYMRVRTTLGVGTATLTFTKCTMWNKVLPDLTSTYRSAQGLMPDILQKDIVLDFFMRYGVLPKEKNGVLYCKTIKEIINEKYNAVDWTAKRTNKESEPLGMNFKFSNYAQHNYLRDKEADDLGELFNRGDLQVPNENITFERTYFTSIFNQTATYKYGNEADGYVTMANIPIIEDGEESNEPGPRVVLIRAKLGDEPGSGYEVGYTIDGRFVDELSWQKYITENYSELQTALSKAKVVMNEYMLTPLDIQAFDIHKLVFDEGVYYIVNTISEFVPGLPTKVELFKVS